MTYTFDEAREIIIEKTGYEISASKLHEHKREGNFKPAGTTEHSVIGRQYPFYDDESIDNFVEYYKTLVATGKTLQWRIKKHTA